MKSWTILSILLVSGFAHADVLMECMGMDSATYTVSRSNQNSDPHAVVVEMKIGDQAVATRAGKLQAAFQLLQGFATISDENGKFFVVGSDFNSAGEMTGFVEMKNHASSKAISCQIK